MKYSAGFGPGGPASEYRYTLGRDWTDEQTLFAGDRWNQVAMFLMLNPSTADAFQDDPTVAKCIRVARRLGYGGLEVRNIFAIRGTDPAVIKQVADPVGPANDDAIRSCASDSKTGLIVAAWGNHGKHNGRSAAIRQLLREVGKPVFCFRVSAQNEPEHPLYQDESLDYKSDEIDLIRWM